jgi:glycosyltransferase involved in cell wall biosynthesis
VLQFTLQLKPELLIVTTSELLLVALLNRILFGAKIIYDIQENYARNILFTDAFPRLLRPLIAFFARLKEWITAPFFSRFLLAERCYTQELGFIKKKYVVLENKCRLGQGFVRRPHADFIQLIFTGTLAESTGVFQVIDLARKLHGLEPGIRLHIIGYCAQPHILREIAREVSQHPFITLQGGDEYVPHPLIMSAIAEANFGAVFYPPSPHTESKIPTKLFEYLACGLPILLQDRSLWADLCPPGAAIIVNFDQPDAQAILEALRHEVFYSGEAKDVYWQSEEKKLLDVVQGLFFRLT